MQTRNILIVDDDASFRATLRKCLSRRFAVTEAASAAEFQVAYGAQVFDLVILDMRLESGREGLTLLRDIRRHDELQPAIVVSAYGDGDAILDAAQSGATMFLHKHEFTPELIGRMVEAVLQQARTQRRLAALQLQLEQQQPLEAVGVSGAAARVGRELTRATEDARAFVLISGEFGSDPEAVAQAIHAKSRSRREAPFVSMDATELTLGPQAGLKASRGLHSQASVHALLERAGGGVLFFSNFEASDPGLRDQLATNLAHNQGADVQVIASVEPSKASSLATWAADKWGTRGFLEIHLTPLRDRLEDLALLATYQARTLRGIPQSVLPIFSHEALGVLEAYAWPGNLLEFKTVVEYAIVRARLADHPYVTVEHLPRGIVDAAIYRDPLNYREVLVRTELELVNAALLAGKGKPRQDLAKELGYNDRLALGRRVRRAFEEFPHMRAYFPEVARVYGNIKRA